MAEEELDEEPYRAAYHDEDAGHLHALSKPAGWFLELVGMQVELVASCLLTLASPFFAFLSETKAAPARLANATRRVLFAVLGALYAFAVVLGAALGAVLLGVAIVRLCLDEPVSARSPIHFDYTLPHPVAVVSLRGAKGRGAVPLGHTVTVSLVLLMPESDHNRRLGVFQVTSEAISSTGSTRAISSQPCMLRYRSLPIRLMRTLVMSFPLLIGMASESQSRVIRLLRYKESKPKTEVIKVWLKPKAGTFDLPQIYEAEILVTSQLPWRKELVYNWKWTSYIWTCLYVFIVLLIILVRCFKPFVLPGQRRFQSGRPREVEKEHRLSFRRSGKLADSLSDVLRRWQDKSKSRRKVAFPHSQLPGSTVEGCASSATGGETSELIDDSGDFASSKSSEHAGC